VNVQTAKILIVDDTEANRYALRRFVERAGHLALEAKTGEQGVALADRELPDVVILDVNLPDMDGFIACRRLKANPVTASIPVIQVSASYIGAIDQVKGLEGGADAYLTQPIEPEVLLATVDAVLRAHRTERELRRVQLQLRSALDAAGMETFCIDWPQQKISRFTEPALLTQSMNADAQSLDDFIQSVHPHDRTALRENMADAVANQVRYEAEYRVDVGDRLRWRLERGQVVTDKFGVALQIIGVSTDITERMAMTEALVQADRRKDEFLAMLAHELRNPLAPIRNAAHVLGHLPLANDGAKSMVAVIHRQVNHMTRLVDDLLDVSRITRGKIELKPELVSLSAVIDYAIETTRPLVDARKHELTLTIEPAPMWVNGDFARLGQALANILSNAAKYTEPRGRIDVEAHVDSGEVVISIKDNGIGIPKKLLPEVFELFMQGDRALDRSQGGLGIGLALVRSLIEFHQGTVSAESDGAGRGSKFVVKLPLSQPPLLVGATTEPLPADCPPRRVLIVDDNRDSAESMAALLRVARHEVHVAHTGPAGLELATEHRPEIVFLDIGLPGMNGFEVAQRLRKIPEGVRATIVAITGYGQPDDRKRSQEAGFDQHLVKPLDPVVVQRILSS